MVLAVVQGVQAYVHGVQPRRRQGVQLRPQQNAVGGQRYLAGAGQGFQRRHQGGYFPPHQRFAPRQFKGIDAAGKGGFGDLYDLLIPQNLLVGPQGHPLGGHAVAAAQVAPVGQRDAQVADGAPVAVGHGAASAW